MGMYFVWTDQNLGLSLSMTFDGVLEESWDEDTIITEHPVDRGANIADHVRVGLIQGQFRIVATGDPLGNNNWDSSRTVTTQLTTPAGPVNPPNPPSLVAKEWINGIGIAGVLVGVSGFVGALTAHEQDTPIPAPDGLPPTQGATVAATTLQMVSPRDYIRATINQLVQLKENAQLIKVVGTKRVVDNMVIERFNHTRNADTGNSAEITIGLKQIRFVSTVTVNAPQPTIPRAKTPINKGPQNPTDAENPANKRSFFKQLIYGTLGGQPAHAGVSE